jgi:hypothetical protein
MSPTSYQTAPPRVRARDYAPRGASLVAGARVLAATSACAWCIRQSAGMRVDRGIGDRQRDRGEARGEDREQQQGQGARRSHGRLQQNDLDLGCTGHAKVRGRHRRDDCGSRRLHGAKGSAVPHGRNLLTLNRYSTAPRSIAFDRDRLRRAQLSAMSPKRLTRTARAAARPGPGLQATPPLAQAPRAR